MDIVLFYTQKPTTRVTSSTRFSENVGEACSTCESIPVGPADENVKS